MEFNLEYFKCVLYHNMQGGVQQLNSFLELVGRLPS